MDKNKMTGFEKLTILILLVVAFTTLLTAIALVFDDDCCCCCGQVAYQGDPSTQVQPEQPDSPVAADDDLALLPAPRAGVAAVDHLEPATQVVVASNEPVREVSAPVVDPNSIRIPPPLETFHRTDPPLWTGDAVEVPEPGTLALLGIGLTALSVGRLK